MQFSKILIATAALAMAVVAAPIAGDEHDGHKTEIHDSGNNISQSGNKNDCSNQADRTTTVCCNEFSKDGPTGGLLGNAEVLTAKIFTDLKCAVSSACKHEQTVYCCKQEATSNGFNLANVNSCGPLVKVN